MTWERFPTTIFPKISKKHIPRDKIHHLCNVSNIADYTGISVSFVNIGIVCLTYAASL